jgi:drug/metabolite transporter (DMT)-like permease
MRAMMEQATTIQQEQQPEMEADDDDVIVTTASSASSKEASLVSPEEYQRGLLTIGFCTLVFASMSPAMHACLVTSSSDIGQTLGAPPVLLLNAAVSVVAFAGLVLAGPFLERVIPQPSTLQMVQEQKMTEQSSSSSSSSVKNKNKATILEFTSQTMMSSTTTTTTSSTFMNENPFTSRNPFTISITNRAGVELGLWKFLGTTANLFGLSLTSADHGAFLIQLTTLIVPTVQGVMGVPIPRRIQASIALALLGVALFTQDFSAVTSAVSATADTTGDVDTAAALLLSTSREQQLTGDALCVLAAVFYATYDLRLYEWGKRVAPRALITTKIGAQALFSLALLLGAPGGAWSESVAFLQAATDSISNGFDNATLLMLIPLILWSGFMVNAIVPFLQVGGQQAIGPTRAQTLYASQPLWAAIMSYFFLGETVGVPGMIGGGAFLAALFLAATAAPATSPAAALLESSSGSSSDISPRINTETTTAPGTSVTTAKSAIAAEQAM